MITKICTKCGIEKRLPEFYKKKGGKLGVHAECKVCHSERRRKNYLRNGHKERAKMKEYALKNVESITEYQTKWREENKEYISKYAKKWKEQNVGRIKEYDRQNYINNSETIKLRVSEYQKNNRHINNAAAVKYRAAKLRATPKWAELDKILKIYKAAQELGMHVDHIVPLQGKTVCGLHCWHNLQLLNASINSSKSNIEWPDK